MFWPHHTCRLSKNSILYYAGQRYYTEIHWRISLSSWQKQYERSLYQENNTKILEINQYLLDKIYLKESQGIMYFYTSLPLPLIWLIATQETQHKLRIFVSIIFCDIVFLFTFHLKSNEKQRKRQKKKILRKKGLASKF